MQLSSSSISYNEQEILQHLLYGSAGKRLYECNSMMRVNYDFEGNDL